MEGEIKERIEKGEEREWKGEKNGEDREGRRENEEGREDRRERGDEISEGRKGIERREQTGWKWERKEKGERKGR